MKKFFKKLSCAMLLGSIAAVPFANISLTTIQAQETESADWREMETTIRQNLDADGIELLYSADVADVHTYEENDMTVTLHGYAYFEIEGFDRNQQILFGDQNDRGGVLVLDISVDNNSDETVYHGNDPDVDFPALDLYTIQSDDYIDGIEHDFMDLDRSLESKSYKRGYFAYAVKPEAMDGLEEVDGTALVDLFEVYETEEFDRETRIMDGRKATIALTEDAEEQVANLLNTYPDAITQDNLGSKDILDSGEGLDAYVESEGIEVQVEGYQFTEFTPNAAEASRYSNFPSGVVTANIKLNIYNNTEDEVIDQSGISGNLILGGMVETRNESLLELDYYGQVIEPGDMGTYYMVFTMEKDLYEKFAEDPFSVNVNVRNTDFEALHDYQALIVDVER